MKEIIKTTEEKILDLITNSPQTISTIKRALNLDYKNAWRYCRKLYDKKVVDLIPPPEKTKKGKPVYIVLKIEETERDYILRALKEIKKRGGRIKNKDYTLLFFTNDYARQRIVNSALWKLQFMNPALIELEYFLTDKGKQFLKENSK